MNYVDDDDDDDNQTQCTLPEHLFPCFCVYLFARFFSSSTGSTSTSTMATGMTTTALFVDMPALAIDANSNQVVCRIVYL